MMKPILFNTEMVQAIMEGRKTCTRRVVKNLRVKEYEATLTNGKRYTRYTLTDINRNGIEQEDFWYDGELKNISSDESILAYSRYKAGDILYIRETWSTQYNGVDDDNGYGEYVYKADGVKLDNSEGISCSKWKPSIHMPKEAARIFLRVTNVRVERLQKISDKDIQREGILDEFPPLAEDAFIKLWNSTVQKHDWLSLYENNPWVWVIEFEVVYEDPITGEWEKVFKD